MAQNAAVQQAIQGALLQSLQVAEEKIDNELEKLEKLDEDDLESIRRKRIEEMKQAQKMKQKWAVQGHGTYEEISDQKEFFKKVKAASVWLHTSIVRPHGGAVSSTSTSKSS